MNQLSPKNQNALMPLSEDQIQVIRRTSTDPIPGQESLSKIPKPEEGLAKRDLDVVAY